MIAVLSDTHEREEPNLTGRTRAAVDEAGLVIHAGDFVREPVLSAFEDRSTRLAAVYGNVDDEPIRERLPETRTVTRSGVRIAIVHTRRGGDTALALFGREQGVDLVIHGHSHQPRYRWTGQVGLLNPGSHADPRGNRPAHAELEVTDKTLEGRLVEPDGTVFQRFRIETDR